MSATNAFESDLLRLLLNNTDLEGIGDTAGLLGSAAAGVFYLSLHTADPGEAGSQSTSEANYTSYARVAVVRTSSGWTISGNEATNAALIEFPACTGGSSIVTHVGIGTASSGSGYLALVGTLASSLSVSNNITPSFAIGAITVAVE